MASFDDFTSQLEGELKALVQQNWKDVTAEASKDADAFLKQSEDDLRRWTQQLADGSLTIQDFEFLLGAKKDLAALVSLKQAGLGQIRLESFLSSVLTTVVAVATKVFAASLAGRVRV
jgi:hypothetical protein